MKEILKKPMGSIILLFFALLVAAILLRGQTRFPSDSSLNPMKLVAHAGGGINGLYYTNSLESIEKNYKKGFKFFELDFEWTSDNELVLIHDWHGTFKKFYGAESKPYSLKDFEKLKMLNGLTQITLDELSKWLRLHSDAYIITDIKSRNIDGLKTISNKYPGLIKQFIPQIYLFEEYDFVKKMGFDKIIITLYVKQYPDDVLIDFLRNHPVFAVTMPVNKALSFLPRKLNEMNVFVYSHTINSKALMGILELNKVNGCYTDLLSP